MGEIKRSFTNRKYKTTRKLTNNLVMKFKKKAGQAQNNMLVKR